MLRVCIGLALTLILTIVAGSDASDKRATGTVDGNIFSDATYGFTITKYNNWKYGKIDKEDPAKPRLTRCVVTQKGVAYPSAYFGNEDKFTLPTIGVFVDTSDMVLDAYAAELADRKSKRASRRELASEFEVLAKGTFVEQQQMTLDAGKAIALHFRQDYEVQLYNRLKDQYSLKEDAVLGDIYLSKRGNVFYLLTLTCEREIYRAVNEEAKTMIMSVDFDPPADSTQGANSGAPGQ